MMPLRAPRYIHVQTPNGKFNGVSVYFFSHADEPNVMGYQVALCSKNDHFCKRTAREVCLTAKTHTCRVVDFPSVLGELVAKCEGYLPHPAMDRPRANEFAWVYKYFL